MISVVLYGRNDAHGYNLHRRAALSLNCIAEVLTDPDDEIIFVDYNTPDELPTFIEAVADTLTQRCLDRLRVLRVPAAVHARRFAERTHLPALEPIARNVAARRANPANRWLLSTNTDMIFVPLRGQSMSEICADLPDGFYGLPRFELPEWLWEWLPRSDPARAAAEIGRLGPALRLDEPTLSHEWIRFDAPGDCQLILREDFEAVNGFDEEMIHGYHVDSNLSRRLLLHRGSIDTLEPHLAGYHCNHNRTRTVYHGTRVANDLARFFLSVDAPGLPAQRATWGLPDVTVEEVSLRDGASGRCVEVLTETIPDGPRIPSHAYGVPFTLAYDSGHVLPFVADALVLASPDAIIGYVGANTVLQGMLGEVVQRLGFACPMSAVGLDDVTGWEQIADGADVFIVDLGLDTSVIGDAFDPTGKSETPSFPRELAGALAALARLVAYERARCEQTKHPRPMILVNSSSAFWDSYVLIQFDCSYTTVHSRVRRATVKPVAEGDPAALEAEFTRAQQLMRWSARGEPGLPALMLCPEETVDVTGLDEYGGFGGGWSMPEMTGIWTEGERAELRIAPDGVDSGDCQLSLSVAMICVEPNETLRVEVHANGVHIATRRFIGPAARQWRMDLPADAVGKDELALTFLVDSPRSPVERGWSADERRLGVHIRDFTLEQLDRRLRVGERVSFSEGSGAERFLGNGWSVLEPIGVWSEEDIAALVFRLTEPRATDVELVLELFPFVTAEHPEVAVEIRTASRPSTTYTFRHGEQVQALRMALPGAACAPDGRTVVEFEVREPARPVDLGVGSDARRLGVQLRSLTVVERGTAAEHETDATADQDAGSLGRLRKQLSRSIRS